MKKTLAALAVLGAFSGAAFAQNVQLYGIIDGGLEVVDSHISGVDTLTGLASGQQYGSRFGLRGSENLGNGLTAKFALENGFSLDTGKLGQGDRLFGRQAWVGLDSAVGTVAIGRIAGIASGTGSFDMMGALDPFGTGFKDAGLQSTFALTSFRADNSVVYQSGKIAGFQLGAMYSFQANGSEQADTDLNTRYAAIAATYAVGNLWTGLSYEQLQNPVTKGISIADTKVIKVGANYDFGFVKPYVAYSNGADVRSLSGLDLDAVGTALNAVATSGFDTNSYMVGATAPLFGGKLMASYQLLDAELSVDSSVKGERNVFAVGYDYPMSKRTSLYGVFSYSKGDDLLNKSGYIAGATDAADKLGNAALETANRSVLQVGIVHKF